MAIGDAAMVMIMGRCRDGCKALVSLRETMILRRTEQSPPIVFPCCENGRLKWREREAEEERSMYLLVGSPSFSLEWRNG